LRYTKTAQHQAQQIWEHDLETNLRPRRLLITLHFKRLSLLLLGSILCILSLALRAEANPQITAWKLSQLSSAWGACTVYISKDAVRIEALDRDFYLLSLAPKWEVVLISDKKKLRYENGANLEVSPIQRFGCNFGHISEYKNKPDFFMALPATLYFSNTKMRIDDPFNFNKFEKSQHKSYSTDVRYTVVQCKNIPKNAVAILTKFYDVPLGSQQVPVSMLHLEDNVKAFRLKTKAIAQVKVDASVFSAKTYPKAAKIEAIILPPTAEATDVMLKDAGFY
jgi:hypothetical protein